MRLPGIHDRQSGRVLRVEQSNIAVGHRHDELAERPACYYVNRGAGETEIGKAYEVESLRLDQSSDKHNTSEPAHSIDWSCRSRRCRYCQHTLTFGTERYAAYPFVIFKIFMEGDMSFRISSSKHRSHIAFSMAPVACQNAS